MFQVWMLLWNWSSVKCCSILWRDGGPGFCVDRWGLFLELQRKLFETVSYVFQISGHGNKWNSQWNSSALASSLNLAFNSKSTTDGMYWEEPFSGRWYWLPLNTKSTTDENGPFLAPSPLASSCCPGDQHCHRAILLSFCHWIGVR